MVVPSNEEVPSTLPIEKNRACSQVWRLMREQPRSDTGEQLFGLYAYLLLTVSDPATTAVPRDRDVHAEKPSVGNLVTSPFPVPLDAAVIATGQSRDDATHQLRRPTSMVQIDGNGRHKPRNSHRFRVQE